MAINLVDQLSLKARQKPQRIAFPEADNDLIWQASLKMVEEGVGTPVILTDQASVTAYTEKHGIESTSIDHFDYADDVRRSELAARCAEKFNDISEKSVMRRAKNPLNAALYLLKLGEVDGVAAGKIYTTGDVINAGMTILGLKDGYETISSLGILDVPGFSGPEAHLLAIGDCAVNPEPDANALADIALSSAETVQELLDWEPRVALLAFSTCGSASHESIEVILEALDIARKRNPDLKIDGEFQLDTAIIPRIAENKVERDSEVAGRANVLIFPNLHAGNIGVKLVQIFGNADAYGPVLQGFDKPICDFSRSAPLSEMWGNILMLIVRAGAQKRTA